MLGASLFNVIEFIGTLIMATKTRNGEHPELFFFSDITNLICKTNKIEDAQIPINKNTIP